MKKLLTVCLFVAACVAATSCKKETAVVPPVNDPASNSNVTALAVLNQPVPLLVAGKAGAKGFTDGTGGNARFDTPVDLCVGTDGSLYVIDFNNTAIRKITTDNKVTTLNISPELFGSPDIDQFPVGIAVLNDGTVGIVSSGYIVLFKPGSAPKQLAVSDAAINLTGYRTFSDICKDPTGTFFYTIVNNMFYTEPANTSTAIDDSFLGTVRNNALSSKFQPLGHQSLSQFIKACPNGYRYFSNYSSVTKKSLLSRITATGTTTPIYNNLNLGTMGGFVINKTGTEIYYFSDEGNGSDNGTGTVIKRIKNNVVTTIFTGLKPRSMALANSEKYLYYTSSDNTVRRIALP